MIEAREPETPRCDREDGFAGDVWDYAPVTYCRKSLAPLVHTNSDVIPSRFRVVVSGDSSAVPTDARRR